MRILISLTLLLAVCSTQRLAEANPTKRSEKVRFGNVTMLFAFEGGVSPTSFKEYIPEGQTLTTWTNFAGIHKYPHVKDPYEFAQNLARAVKRDNPLSQCAILHNEKTDSVILDFITWSADLKFVEFNIWRFERNGQNGIIGYQYAERAYSEQKEFLLNLRALREQSIKTMIDEGLVIERKARITKITSRIQVKPR